MSAETMTEQTVKEGANAAADTMHQAAFAGDKVIRDAMSRTSAMTDHAFKDGVEKSMTALNELGAQNKRNLEAVVESVTAATKGVETLGSHAMAYTKKAVESQVEQAKALSTARSMQELIELQTAFAKTAMEAYIAEMNKAAEVLSSVVKESIRPLNERATALAETMQSAR
ncbi:phasin family protein [Caulobacter sp. S45]|uniref:phasin family protein n=1 Tax=Caulobacter sp. S45 TaxID=1641861 RepID=UPI0020C625F5|nr:TIGR01841 family phasin [Caulobacter sp. S45]